MTDESKAITLFVELYGWIYTYGDNVLKDDFHSMQVLNRWCGLTTELEKKAKQLHNAIRSEITKRAYVKALRLKIKFRELKNEKIYKV